MAALLVVYFVAPLATEVAENAVSLVTTGHAAHGCDDGQHPQGDPEHCCSGIVHVCGCCHSPGFTAPVAWSFSPFTGSAIPAPRAAPEAREDGHLASVFRPPIG